MISVRILRSSRNQKVSHVTVDATDRSSVSEFVLKSTENIVRILRHRAKTHRRENHVITCVVRPTARFQFEAELLIRNLKLLANQFGGELRLRQKLV
jgi:hypothetical protein